MKHKGWIIFGILLFLFIVFVFGTPTEIRFVGTPPFFEITWKTEEESQIPEPQPQPTSQPPKILEIKIDSLKARQEIYQPGDIAYVDFK